MDLNVTHCTERNFAMQDNELNLLYNLELQFQSRDNRRTNASKLKVVAYCKWLEFNKTVQPRNCLFELVHFNKGIVVIIQEACTMEAKHIRLKLRKSHCYTWKTVTKAHNKLSKFFLSHSTSPPLAASFCSQNLQPNRFIPRILGKYWYI